MMRGSDTHAVIQAWSSVGLAFREEALTPPKKLLCRLSLKVRRLELDVIVIQFSRILCLQLMQNLRDRCFKKRLGDDDRGSIHQIETEKEAHKWAEAGKKQRDIFWTKSQLPLNAATNQKDRFHLFPREDNLGGAIELPHTESLVSNDQHGVS